MTLADFFTHVSERPLAVCFFAIAVPFTAFLAGIFSKDESYLSPWKYVYSGLVYLCSVPGILAITLTIYLLVFERRSILDTNIYLQIFPILSMFLTLYLIKRSVDLDRIPGFDRLTGLITILAVIIVVLWILDRTHILAITFLPFHYVILIFIGLVVLARFGWKRVAA